MRRGRGWRIVAAQAGAGGRLGAMHGARIYFWAFHQDDREGRQFSPSFLALAAAGRVAVDATPPLNQN